MARRLKIAAAQLGPIHLADDRASVVRRLCALLREAHGRGPSSWCSRSWR